MGTLHGKQPALVEVGVGVALVIGSAAETVSIRAMPQDAAELHANLTIHYAEHARIAVLKVLKPAAERAIDVGNDREQAVAMGASSLSYGLVVHIPLFSTSPLGDAVTCGYGAQTRPEEEFHLAHPIPSQAH